MTNNIQDLLKEINTSRAYDVFIPSLNTYAKLKPLIIEQIRNIIESVTTETYFEIGFQAALINIIADNLITENINVNMLTEYDKLIIALYIRINDISPIYNNIDISNKKTTITEYPHPASTTIENEGIQLTCKVPTLAIERNYTQYILAKVKDKTDDSTALKAVINVLLLAEITKYISAITINSTTTEQPDIFSDWVKTVEALPVTVLKRVIEYIDSVKSLREDILKIDDTTNIEFNLRLFTS
jgi:hypothetical protein